MKVIAAAITPAPVVVTLKATPTPFFEYVTVALPTVRARARLSLRAVTRLEAMLAAGQGAVTYEGKMIDVPIVERGRRILALRDRIPARG